MIPTFWGLVFLRLQVSDSCVWWLVLLRLGVSDSYVWALVSYVSGLVILTFRD